MADLTITLGGWTVPMRVVTDLPKVKKPNGGTNRTLSGRLYEDFAFNGTMIQTWTLRLAYLCEDDYSDLDDVYMNQYRNEAYPQFVCSRLGINTPVRLSIDTFNFRQDGDTIEGVELTLEQVFAVS